MDLEEYTPNRKTEKIILSIAKNTKILIEQTMTKAQETLKHEPITPKETYRFVYIFEF